MQVQGSATRRDPTELVSLAVALAYTAAVVVFVLRYCYFYGDDFSGFLISRTESFFSGVLYPVGGQVVPLARALNFVFFEVAGLSYGAAVTVLCVFHALGAYYLWRTLELFGRSVLNAVLVAVYACYIHTWVQLGWWVAGLERGPFVALSLVAVYHYVRHERTCRRRDLVIACASDLLALGFYGKALFLPLLMVGLDLARFPVSELRARAPLFATRWLTALGLFAAGVICSIVEYRVAVSHGLPLAGGALKDPLRFIGLGLLAYTHAFFGVAMSEASHGVRPWVIALWVLLVGYTCARARRAMIAWAVLFTLVVANLAVIGLSTRVAVFGAKLAFEVRYYWELWFFTCLLAGIVLKQLPTTTPEAAFVARLPAAVPRVVTAALLVAYAAASYHAFSTTALSDADPMPRTRSYVRTLTADLERMNSPSARLKLADDFVPGYLIGLDFTFIRQSQLLFLIGQRVAYVLPEKAEYRIDQEGHILPIRAKKMRTQ